MDLAVAMTAIAIMIESEELAPKLVSLIAATLDYEELDLMSPLKSILPRLLIT